MVAGFDYNAPADLFPGKGNRPLGYRRFETAVAIEIMPSDLLLGAVLEVEEERLNGHRIRELYDSTSYPFARSRN